MLLEVATVSLPVQINGRTRGVVEVAADASQTEAVDAARHVEAARQVLDGGDVQRIVYVPRRILNVVTR